MSIFYKITINYSVENNVEQNYRRIAELQMTIDSLKEKNEILKERADYYIKLSELEIDSTNSQIKLNETIKNLKEEKLTEKQKQKMNLRINSQISDKEKAIETFKKKLKQNVKKIQELGSEIYTEDADKSNLEKQKQE